MSVRCLRQDVANLTELPFVLRIPTGVSVYFFWDCDYSSHRKPSQWTSSWKEHQYFKGQVIFLVFLMSKDVLCN